MLRIFVQALEADRAQVWIAQTRRIGLIFDNFAEQAWNILGGKRRLAGEQFGENHAQSIDVRRGGEVLRVARRLLR